MFDLEFTGERVVPGKVDPELQLEHSTRYQLASRWVRGKKVLDFGCGTGYGAAILKRAGASRVIGSDNSPAAVLYAKSHFGVPGVHFCVSDCERAAFADGSFDIVVSFELIEHLDSYPSYLKEVRRLLPETGLFVVSTPNKSTYNDPRHSTPNPFHTHEFALDDFRNALSSFFGTVTILGQSRTEGVLFQGDSAAVSSDPSIDLQSSGGLQNQPHRALTEAEYFVAICSVGSGDELIASDSFHIAESNAVRDRDLRIRELQNELEERAQWARGLENESSRRGQRVVELQGELEEHTRWAKRLESESTEHGHRVLELQAELQERLRWATELETQNEAKKKRIRELRHQLALLGQSMERLPELESQLDKKLGMASAQLENDLRVGLETLSRQLDETFDQRRQGLEQLRQSLEQRQRQTGVKTEQLERLQAALRGQQAWQRDSLIRHQGSLEQQQAKFSESRARLGDLTLLLEQQQQQQQQQRHLVASQTARIDTAAQHQDTTSQLLREKLDQQSAALDHQWRRLEEQHGALEAQGQLLGATEQSVIHTRHLAELLWNSLPWRLYCRLGQGLQHVRRQLPSGRRERLRQQATQATQVAHRIAELKLAITVSSEPKVAIVIPFAEPLELLDCLASITTAGDSTAVEIFAIHLDPPGPVHAALESLEDLRLWRARKPGRAAALQLAARKMRAPHLLLLASNGRPEKGWLDSLCRTFEHYPDAGLVGGRLLLPEGKLLAAGGILWQDATVTAYGNGEDPELRSFSFAREVEFCDDACWLIHQRLIDSLNLIDSELLDSSQRAADFSLRARQLGARTYYQPSCRVRMFGGLSETDPQALEKGRRRLRRHWPAELAAMPAAAPPHSAVASRFARRALVLDHRLPTPDQDSGSVRMDSLLDILQQIGFQVTFLPENLYAMPPYCEPLQERGIEVVITPEETSLRGYLARHGEGFELAIVSRFHIATSTLDMVRELCPSALLVFDTVDLQFLRLQRQAELENDPELAAEAERMRKAEIELSRRADAVLVVSEVERELLRHHAPDLDVHLVSNIHHTAAPVSDYDQRQDFYFIGGFEHPPNQDAMFWFCEEIWPKIRQELPAAKLHLIGSKVTKELRALAGEGVEVVGFVADLMPYLKGCRLSVAPLRYGAGVKGKVTQSLAYGLPTVVTTIAAEGIGLEHGVSAMIADDPESFAQAVVQVYRDQRLWQRLSKHGQQAFEARFSPANAQRAIADLLRQHGR